MTRGYGTVWRGGQWVYTDTGAPVDMSVPYGGADRPCAGCGQLPTPLGHDACIAGLPGVRNACCGHGHGPEGSHPDDPQASPGYRQYVPYVELASGTYLRGQAAMDFFAAHGRVVPSAAG